MVLPKVPIASPQQTPMHHETSVEFSKSRLEMADTMAESKQSQHALLINDGLEDFETLLPKNADCILEKSSSYDLQKLPQTPSHLNSSGELPLELSMDFKTIMLSPSFSRDGSDQPLSGQSDDDNYLPATLRSAISITNKPPPPPPGSKDPSKKSGSSPSISKRKKKQLRAKKAQNMRRSKSDKNMSLRASDSSNEANLTKSLHALVIEPKVDDETLLIDEFAEAMSKSEEIRRVDKSGSEKKRRKSETFLPRPGSSHRESRRTRKKNPDKDSSTPEPSKVTNMRRSKPQRSRSRPKSAPSLSKEPVKTEEDKQNFDWSTLYCYERDETSKEQKKSVPLPELPKEKQKSKKLSRSSHDKSKRSRSRTNRSLSRSLRSTGESKDDIDWKRPSPRQEQQKRPKPLKQKSPKSLPKPSPKPTPKSMEQQKQKSPKPTPKSVPKSMEQKKQKSPKPTPKSIGLTDAKPKKSKSRGTKMIASKATTSSCRNLLLKIDQINNDRLSGHGQEEKTKVLDESRSTVSTTQSTSHSQLDDVTFHTSNIACKKPEKSPQTPKAKKSAKSRKKAQEGKKPAEDKDGKPSKPKRTKSAPLSDKIRKKVEEKKKAAEDQVQEEKTVENIDGKPSKPKRTKSAPLAEKFRKKVQEGRKRVEDQLRSEKNPTKEQDEKRKNPLRTKSDPLTPKGKGNNNISRSRSGGALSNASSNTRKARAKKKPLSTRLIDFGLSLDIKMPKRQPPRRSKSDSSLRRQLEMNSSGYDLMASMHSDFSSKELSKELSKKQVLANDCNSFCDDSDLDEGVPSIRDLQKICERSNRGLVGTVPPPSQNYEDSMTSEIMAGFMNFGTRYRPNHAERRRSAEKARRISGNSRSCAVVVEDSDDVLSMVEHSEQFEVSSVLTETNEPKAPVSCLQIDFSQLSKQDNSGDVVVRSKKVERKIAKIEQKIAANSKSKNQLRSPLSPPRAA